MSADEMAENATSIFSSAYPTINSTATDTNCSINDGCLRFLLAVIYSLLFLLGLVGNLVAFWVFLRLHTRKNSVRIFLINLAIADLLLVICLPFRVAYHANNERWEYSPIFCRIVGNIFYMNIYVSIILLGLISIDRYVKLQRVTSSQKFLNRRRSLVTCCLLWAGCIAFIIPMIISTGNKSRQSNKCFQYKDLRNETWKAYMNFAVVVVFWVVYGALVTCYGKIAMGLLRVSRERPDLPNAVKYSRTARKSFFVLFLFTVCFVPYHLVRIFYILSQIMDVSCQWRWRVDKANELVLLLSAFNSCLDPVMYFMLCGSVRRAVLPVIRKTLCLESTGVSDISSSETLRVQKDQQTLSETSTLRRKTAVNINSPNS